MPDIDVAAFENFTLFLSVCFCFELSNSSFVGVGFLAILLIESENSVLFSIDPPDSIELSDSGLCSESGALTVTVL